MRCGNLLPEQSAKELKDLVDISLKAEMCQRRAEAYSNFDIIEYDFDVESSEFDGVPVHIVLTRVPYTCYKSSSGRKFAIQKIAAIELYLCKSRTEEFGDLNYLALEQFGGVYPIYITDATYERLAELSKYVPKDWFMGKSSLAPISYSKPESVITLSRRFVRPDGKRTAVEINMYKHFARIPEEMLFRILDSCRISSIAHYCRHLYKLLTTGNLNIGDTLFLQKNADLFPIVCRLTNQALLLGKNSLKHNSKTLRDFARREKRKPLEDAFSYSSMRILQIVKKTSKVAKKEVEMLASYPEKIDEILDMIYKSCAKLGEEIERRVKPSAKAI